MTKEETIIKGILKKHSSEVDNWNDAVFEDKFNAVENDITYVIEHYADQQTKEKDKEINQLKQQLKEKSEEGWISVRDRLPNTYGQYLIYCPTSFAKNCRFLPANYYDDNKKFYGDASEVVHEDVTHWMEIKEPLNKQ